MYVKLYGLLHFTIGGHGVVKHSTSSRLHVSNSAHPPLFREHDGLQYADPDHLSTSQVYPLAQRVEAQGSATACIINMTYLSYTYLKSQLTTLDGLSAEWLISFITFVCTHTYLIRLTTSVCTLTGWITISPTSG